MCPFLNFYIKLLLFLILISFWSCKNHCGKNSSEFWSNYSEFISTVQAEQKDINHHIWDQYDKKFQVFHKDCYPKYTSDLNTSQQDSFWMLGFAYVYSRYQMDLIKKFRKTDYTINVIRDSLTGRKMDIFVCMDSLRKDWPAIQALKAKERDRLERYFRRERRDTLLPSYPLDSLQ